MYSLPVFYNFFICFLSRTVRAISSDRGKVVSGSDDHSILVWDKQTTQLLEELKGHNAQVSFNLFMLDLLLSICSISNRECLFDVAVCLLAFWQVVLFW